MPGLLGCTRMLVDVSAPSYASRQALRTTWSASFERVASTCSVATLVFTGPMLLPVLTVTAMVVSAASAASACRKGFDIGCGDWSHGVPWCRSLDSSASGVGPRVVAAVRAFAAAG